MTLTEEQREALDFALEYLVDDPNDDRDSNLANSIRTIRAMINSSKHVIDPTKMIGFDLEVRWHDDYMKRFSDITAWHCGHATLWIMHSSGKQEWIPLASVRRISSVEESP